VTVSFIRPVLLVEKPEYPEKTTDLLQVTDKLYHIEITLVLLPNRRKSYEWLKHQGTYKVRNEIETKRNKTKRNQRKRNETKRNQRKRNETKSTKWKRNETKPTK
jgi:hypothetical protein